MKHNRKAAEESLDLLNREKQQKMNELDVVVPLKLNQVTRTFGVPMLINLNKDSQIHVSSEFEGQAVHGGAFVNRHVVCLCSGSNCDCAPLTTCQNPAESKNWFCVSVHTLIIMCDLV